jgi:RNA polymerase sigma-70 factor (ECF subfamily)
MSHDSSDEGIAERVQNGEKEFFGVLVERYEDKLLRYGRRFLSTEEDIEDLVQDIFLKAYENILSFDASQRFSPWIYRIAHNTFVNALRKRSRTPLSFFDFDTLLPHPAYEDPAEAERESREVKTMIDAYLDQVGEKYKEVLILYYLEEQSYKEIGDILHLPVSTVGIRLKRGREALRKVYETINQNGKQS